MVFDLDHYPDGYRWHTTASSDITGHGGQGYSRRIDCEQGAADVAEAILLGIGREHAEQIVDRILTKWGDRRSLAHLINTNEPAEANVDTDALDEAHATA